MYSMSTNVFPQNARLLPSSTTPYFSQRAQRGDVVAYDPDLYGTTMYDPNNTEESFDPFLRRRGRPTAKRVLAYTEAAPTISPGYVQDRPSKRITRTGIESEQEFRSPPPQFAIIRYNDGQGMDLDNGQSRNQNGVNRMSFQGVPPQGSLGQTVSTRQGVRRPLMQSSNVGDISPNYGEYTMSKRRSAPDFNNEDVNVNMMLENEISTRQGVRRPLLTSPMGDISPNYGEYSMSRPQPAVVLSGVYSRSVERDSIPPQGSLFEELAPRQGVRRPLMQSSNLGDISPNYGEYTRSRQRPAPEFNEANNDINMMDTSFSTQPQQSSFLRSQEPTNTRSTFNNQLPVGYGFAPGATSSRYVSERDATTGNVYIRSNAPTSSITGARLDEPYRALQPRSTSDPLPRSTMRQLSRYIPRPGYPSRIEQID